MSPTRTLTACSSSAAGAPLPILSGAGLSASDPILGLGQILGLLLLGEESGGV